MLVIIFLLGRPSSGKSTVASLIQMLAHDHHCFFHFTNDYDHLQRMFLREEAGCTSLDDRDFLRRESESCNGFDVKNFTVLDIVLKEMKKEVEDVKNTCPQNEITICIVEFARANYQHAIELFGKELLAEALLLYMNVDIDTCIERNHKRTDHFISDEIMTTYYHYDDWARKMYNLQDSHDKSEIRNTGTLDDLKRKVEEWFEVHLEDKVPVHVAFSNMV
jgi:tRNA uridine 5-carbamoylmethylation protein Kti12